MICCFGTARECDPSHSNGNNGYHHNELLRHHKDYTFVKPKNHYTKECTYLAIAGAIAMIILVALIVFTSLRFPIPIK